MTDLYCKLLAARGHFSCVTGGEQVLCHPDSGATSWEREALTMRRIVLILLALLSTLITCSAVHAAVYGYSVQSNGNDHLYRIDLTTGLADDLGAVGLSDAEGLAFVGSQLYSIGGTVPELWNLTTPPGVLVGATGARNGVDAGLSYDPSSGTLYNLNSSGGNSNLYTINVATGAATLVGTSDEFADSIAIDSSGQAYAVDAIFTDSLYSVNLATGDLSLVGSLQLGNISAQSGSAFFGDTLYALFSDGSIFTVDTITGQASLVAQTLRGFEGLAIQSRPVPTPSTGLVFIGLALCCGAMTWRRRQVGRG